MKLKSLALFAATAAALAAAVPADAGSAQTLVVVGPHGRLTHDARLHGFYFSQGDIYYRGMRGYRHPRPGHLHFGGYWFPRYAFKPGEPIVAPPQYAVPRHNALPRHALTVSHYRWCDAKYRSYRYEDNTFQPYHGPRKHCVSPYYR